MRPSRPPGFDRYVGIDYSGAATATTGLPGLRVYAADRATAPVEVLPPARRHWTRRDVAEWLALRLSEPRATLVGIDHGFSFPLRYFERHGLAHDWPAFLEDFRRHWPTDADGVSVQAVRDGDAGHGAARTGSARWRRVTEQRAHAKSVFHFDVPGSVAKSTHAGLPWLRLLRDTVRPPLHCWPFDGWSPRSGQSTLVEAYPALCSFRYARRQRSPDQHDAYAVAAWLRETDLDGTLAPCFAPPGPEAECRAARIEGWILGVR